MIVYIVLCHEYGEESWVEGVYATRELAEEVAADFDADIIEQKVCDGK